MDNDVVTTIDPPGILRRLLAEEKMANSVIVSEVHSCSAYVRVLTSDLSKDLSIGLTAEPPVTPVSPTAKVDVRWVYNDAAGNFRSKVDNKGERRFYPLFRLVSLKESAVSTGLRSDAPGGPPPLPDALPPWTDEEDTGRGMLAR